ncbi:MAG: hypothetical protein JXX14_03575, partial [Deltaproteobacteria bacterium]|nr:hypothetical protein [Deltaproteobacteria bacterium]
MILRRTYFPTLITAAFLMSCNSLVDDFTYGDDTDSATGTASDNGDDTVTTPNDTSDSATDNNSDSVTQPTDIADSASDMTNDTESDSLN